MLVDLTPNTEEIKRRTAIAAEHDFEYIPQTHPTLKLETGIYQSAFPFNFSEEEFIEKLEGWHYSENQRNPDETPLEYYVRNSENWVHQYGIADNIEQIKEFYKAQIEDPKDKFCIAVTPVFQDKANKGKGGGWRWHKWGIYIGKLEPQCEYLDDEEFGDDFQYVLCFHLYYIKESAKSNNDNS